jgi:formylglycine-generating enzyme required for sulfatase activity
MSRARGIDQPPSPEEEEHFNRRVQIDAGTFMMGSPRGEGDDDEWPQHRVKLSAFRIQEHEVTNEEYRRFDPSHGRGKPNLEPVTDVSWYDAMAYAFWVGGNLPTEAQWEFTARGANGREYPWSDKSDPTCNRAQFDRCQPSGRRAVKAGRELGKTAEGVYDLAGNVREWCRDVFDSYHEGEQTDPLGLPTGRLRVLRGGSFLFDRHSLRAASRDSNYPGPRRGYDGFRVVSSRARP